MADTPKRRRMDVEEVGDVCVVTILEKNLLDEQHIQMIGNDLSRLVDELGKRKVVMDFTPTEFMASAMIREMINVHRKLERHGSKLVLCNVAKDIMDVLRTIGVSPKIIPYAVDLAAAVASF